MSGKESSIVKKRNKEQQQQQQLPQLPEDIIFSHILVRACPKSVLRSKRVRKSWYSAIRNPKFIDEYLENSRTRPTLLFTTHHQALKKQYFFSINTQHTLNLVYQLDTATELSISQNVNGMFCIYPPTHTAFFYKSSSEAAAAGGAYIYVFNPTTREMLSIPTMPNPMIHAAGNYNVNLICYFFGFDVKTRLYKVVGINCNISTQDLRVVDHVQCGIFTVGGGGGGGASCWRMIKVPIPVSFKPCCTPGVCVNGAIHWLVKDKRAILAFDLHTESFRAFHFDDGIGPIGLVGTSTGGLLDDDANDRDEMEYDDEYEDEDEFDEQEPDQTSSVWWPRLIQVGTNLGVVEYNDDELRIWVLKDYNNQEWVMERFDYPYDWNLMHAVPYGSSLTAELYLVLNHNSGWFLPHIVCCDTQQGTHHRIEFVEYFDLDDAGSSGVRLSLVDSYPANIMPLPKLGGI